MSRGKLSNQSLGFQLAPNEPLGEIVLRRLETQVQFAFKLAKRFFELTLSLQQFGLFLAAAPDLEVLSRNLFFHLADGLPQHLLRLFYLVQYGMEIRFKQL
jgi:hypothetical protein